MFTTIRERLAKVDQLIIAREVIMTELDVILYGTDNVETRQRLETAIGFGQTALRRLAQLRIKINGHIL